MSLGSKIRPEISWDLTSFYLTLSIKLTPIPRHNFRVKNWTQLKNIPRKGNRGTGDGAQLVDWAPWHRLSPRFENQQSSSAQPPRWHTGNRRMRNLESSWATHRVLFKGSLSYLESWPQKYFLIVLSEICFCYRLNWFLATICMDTYFLTLALPPNVELRYWSEYIAPWTACLQQYRH